MFILFPPAVLVGILGFFQVNEVNLLLFGVSYLWPIVLSSKKLREKSQHSRQRYSFLRCVFLLHDLPIAHPLVRQYLASHYGIQQLFPFLGPIIFAWLMWMITSTGNLFFVLLAMLFYFSVQWFLRRCFPQVLLVDF